MELSALVLGIGNILLSDEGLGVKAIDELERRYVFPQEVELLDGGTSGIELIPYMSGKKHLIIIDAVQSENPPGSVLFIEGEDVPKVFRTKISPHQLGLSDLLATAALTGEIPEHLALFGIEPKSMQAGIGLSEEVEANFGKMIEAVVDKLKAYGYEVKTMPKNTVSKPSFWDAALA